MATVVMAKEFQQNLKLDGSLKKNAWDLVRKLSAEEDLNGLRLKKPKGALDPRVRVARVTDDFRAVLFAAGTEHDAIYLVVAIQKHDPAYDYAAKLRMRINPVNGVFEVLRDAVAHTPDSPSSEEIDQVVEHQPAAIPLRMPFTAQELIDIGISDSLAQQAVTLADENALQELCVRAPSWQGSALLDLAIGGSTLDEVTRRYAGDKSGAAVEVDENPEQIRESLQRAGSQMEFVVFTGDEHMRRILEGDLHDWRIFLHPDQRALAHNDGWNGSFRITGGAGTGKTVVALHRAVYLAQRTDGEVLVTTFTRNLAEELRRQLAQLADPETMARIVVRGVDQLARDIVIRAHGQVAFVLPDNEERKVWRNALDQVELSGQENDMFTSEFMAREYRQIILGKEVRTRQDYLKVIRHGRKVRLNKLQRSTLWDVIEKFNEQLDLEERTTYPRIVAESARIVQGGATRDAGRFSHVLVDEAQDLSPSHWRLLRGVVPDRPNDLFICEDGHQRIYGEKIVLSHYGIRTQGRSRKLTLNYRTTKQVLRLAIGVLSGESFVDLDEEVDSVDRYRSLLKGPDPSVRGFSNEADEQKYVVETVSDWIKGKISHGGIAVLGRDKKIRDRFLRALQDARIPAVVADGDDRPGQRDAVQLATMHRVKGIEYLRVIVVGANDRYLPYEVTLKATEPDERDEARQQERCLFYVACTRPRDELVVTYTGNRTPFLPAP